MKKRIYLTISSIIQIIAASYYIANANHIVEETIKSVKKVYSMFPVDFQERVISVFQNGGNYYFIGTSAICIIINLIILFLAINNKISSKKTLLIILTVFVFFTTSSSLSIILVIVNFILVMQLKEDTISKNKDKKELPIIEKEMISKKDIILSIILLIVYFSQFIWSSYIPENNIILSRIIVIGFYALMFGLVVGFFYKKLISDFKILINNFEAYFKYTAPKYAIMLVCFIIVNFICILITNKATSVNQEAVESLSKISLLILGVIWAPVVEETLFRGVIKRFIRNNTVFIIVSALVFGLLHSISEENILNVIVTTIPYATLGGFLAYVYSKTNNLANNILMHASWNFVASIISILTMIIFYK